MEWVGRICGTARQVWTAGGARRSVRSGQPAAFEALPALVEDELSFDDDDEEDDELSLDADEDEPSFDEEPSFDDEPLDEALSDDEAALRLSVR